MSSPRVWRWLSWSGGLVLVLAGVLGLTAVLGAPGGSAESAWLGGWRLAAGVAVLLGAWWMGRRPLAGGVVVLVFGVAELAIDAFSGALHGWAALLLVGAWLLLTSFMRLRDDAMPPGLNLLGVLAGAAAVLTGAGIVLLVRDVSALGTAPAVALALIALWATWLGGWQVTRSN